MKRAFLIAALAVIVAVTRASAQDAALEALVGTEQRFAARALVVGWKRAFLEYFAETAVGFDGDRVAPARTLFQSLPDPPKNLRLLWEPRYGDIAASGDLGYLTGPVRRINPARDQGRPSHSVYASVWQRQPDGTFKVVLDMGVSTPGPAVFANGFVRAPRRDIYSGAATQAASERSLKDTDAALTNTARASQADAYRGHLAEGARLHRPDETPLVGPDAIVTWLMHQPAYTAGETRFAGTAASGDLGYTYGSYAVGGATPSHGFYGRVWVRGRDGVWRIALDVLQPQ